MKRKKDAAKGEAAEEPARKKEQKIVYIDDNSTVADMSGLTGGVTPQKSTFREKMRTYFAVAKKMLIPMFATLAAFAIVYLIFLAAAGKL